MENDLETCEEFGFVEPVESDIIRMILPNVGFLVPAQALALAIALVVTSNSNSFSLAYAFISQPSQMPIRSFAEVLLIDLYQK